MQEQQRQGQLAEDRLLLEVHVPEPCSRAGGQLDAHLCELPGATGQR